MDALMQNSNPSQPSSAPLPPDLEPDEEWKQTLKLKIEAGLRSMYDEAKQKLNDELAKALVSPEERERLTADHLATLKTIRQLAEEQFRIALERERQERRWASGEQLDRAWSESMIMEQQAILDKIERERKNKSGQSDARPLPPPPPPPLPPQPQPQPQPHPQSHPQPKPDSLPESVIPLPNRKPERVARAPTQILDDPHSFSPIHDEPDEIPPFPRTRPARAGSITSLSSWKAPDDKSILGKPLHDEPIERRESIRRKPSMARSIVQEFWKPSITPEEDAYMSRTFTLARRSSTASASSYKAPSVLHAALSDPLDVAGERAEEWSPTYRPPPSASRPIANKRSFTVDDFPQSSPSARWPRSPYGLESRSPQTPDDRWQPPLRARFSTQDMRNYFQEHRVREDFEEDLDDAFGWRERDYHERQMQELEEGLRRREEMANRREEELARKAEVIKREDDVRKKRADEQRREEERLEEERQREDDERKADELRRKEEEADRKEREAATRQEEARKKEEEARRKEEEAKKKEEEVMRKEKETRRKEEELKRKERDTKSREMVARRKEEDARRKEEEVRVMEEEARRKDYEARRKQEEAERKEEEARRRTEEISIKAEETRKKEEELRKREDELKRREEDLNRREAEMRRREDDRLQDEFRKREEDIRRQRAEEKKKQEVWETWPQETFQPSPSPQTPNSSGPWPIPNRNERSGSTTNPPIDRMSTSASSRSNPVSGWSSASVRPGSTTGTQTSTTPKPTGPSTPTPKPYTNNTPNPSVTEAEFHRRQAEQAQQREEQFRREQARLAMQEHERQAKSGRTMSKEEVSKLFEAHRGQWEKLGTLGSLIWEDFPWPMFKQPKGPDDLTSAAITAYMLSSVHPQDRATKERIKDNIRRWHPDRFNSQFLPKVKESERERVFEGSGSVARILNDLLRMHSQDVF